MTERNDVKKARIRLITAACFLSDNIRNDPVFDVITVENIHSEIEHGCKRTDEEISCKYRPLQYKTSLYFLIASI